MVRGESRGESAEAVRAAARRVRRARRAPERESGVSCRSRSRCSSLGALASEGPLTAETPGFRPNECETTSHRDHTNMSERSPRRKQVTACRALRNKRVPHSPRRISKQPVLAPLTGSHSEQTEQCPRSEIEAEGAARKVQNPRCYKVQRYAQ